VFRPNWEDVKGSWKKNFIMWNCITGVVEIMQMYRGRLQLVNLVVDGRIVLNKM